MNQKKIGLFLKQLRHEKGLTQEKFAEIVNVSNRTVSRWENGNNMPDLDVLIEISDYYEVELREILDGERKSEKMNKEMEDTVLKAVDYTNTEYERIYKRVRIFNALAILFMILSLIIKVSELDHHTTIKNAVDFAEGATLGLLVTGFIISSQYGLKIRAFKQRLFNNKLK